MNTQEIKSKIKNAKDDLAGVATDIADKEKVTAKRVKDALHNLNNNHAGDNDFNKDA